MFKAPLVEPHLASGMSHHRPNTCKLETMDTPYRCPIGHVLVEVSHCCSTTYESRIRLVARLEKMLIEMQFQGNRFRVQTR
jgi:hypothetical protein